MAAVTASTGNARRLINQAMTAITQLPHRMQPSAVTHLVQHARQFAAQSSTPEPAPGPAHSKSTSQITLKAGADAKVEMTKASPVRPVIKNSGPTNITESINNS